MRERLVYLWWAVRDSFWFLPAVLTLAAVGLSFLTVAIDRATKSDARLLFGWTYRGGADGAREVLGTVAASMITVAGVVFSITVVALSLASQQFGPRLIRNFTSDRGNQFVLGTFLATFVYCLLVLRTVNGGDDNPFVPELGVTVGVLLALASLGVLIYFIHHVAVSIQASAVVGRVADELAAASDELFPEQIGEGAGETPPAAPPPAAVPVRAEAGGYVRAVDADGVLAIAADRDLVVYLTVPPGRFVYSGDPVAWVTAASPPGEDAVRAVRAAVQLGPSRTGYQDVEFSLLQLTEIAVRALSPGVNDPFTTIECVDRLGEALARLAGRRFPSPERSGADGRVRVVARTVTFPELLDAAFDPVRHHAGGSPLVLRRLLNALAAIGSQTRHEADRAAVRQHAERVLRTADALPEPDDREAVRAAGRPLAGGGDPVV